MRERERESEQGYYGGSVVEERGEEVEEGGVAVGLGVGVCHSVLPAALRHSRRVYKQHQFLLLWVGALGFRASGMGGLGSILLPCWPCYRAPPKLGGWPITGLCFALL